MWCFRNLILVFLILSNAISTVAFQQPPVGLRIRQLLRFPTLKQNDFSLLSLPSSRMVKPTPKSNKKSSLLTHERDFFRQVTRLESMDSYVLVSTLTASMSFGALLGFTPTVPSSRRAVFWSAKANFLYTTLCLAIQVTAGLSSLYGLYATIIFSLTILISKSALGTERDVEYDRFLQKTSKVRVNGYRSFEISMLLFALEAVMVLVERTTTTFRAICTLPVFIASGYILFKLCRDLITINDASETITKSD
mmetsp:Transcript_29852/g.45238  ORF Transcript_29852/g.45238 Transcript_29852/m.45238 type:complete len:251 (-) Transcript_29852:170-922(-)